jgi:transposase-like protein
MRKERKHFTPKKKVAILRRHLLNKVPVSDLCEELGLRLTVLNRWQKELFENGAAAFQVSGAPEPKVEKKWKRIELLENTVQTKDEVLAELMAEHMALRKHLGNSSGSWMSHDVRDLVVDFAQCWLEKTEMASGSLFIGWA